MAKNSIRKQPPLLWVRTGTSTFGTSARPGQAFPDFSEYFDDNKRARILEEENQMFAVFCKLYMKISNISSESVQARIDPEQINSTLRKPCGNSKFAAGIKSFVKWHPGKMIPNFDCVIPRGVRTVQDLPPDTYSVHVRVHLGLSWRHKRKTLQLTCWI